MAENWGPINWDERAQVRKRGAIRKSAKRVAICVAIVAVYHIAILQWSYYWHWNYVPPALQWLLPWVNWIWPSLWDNWFFFNSDIEWFIACGTDGGLRIPQRACLTLYGQWPLPWRFP